MTELEKLIVKVGTNTATRDDVQSIRDYSGDEVERVITEVSMIAPYWFIQNINQANIWGGDK